MQDLKFFCKVFKYVFIISYFILLLLMVNDTNKRIKHIENEFTLEGNK